jgi:anti-anti-sigma factor
MRFNVSRTPQGVVAHLREGLEISSIAQDRDHLLDLMAPGSVLRLDLEGIADIDTAGVQLLLALSKESTAKGGALELANANEAVRSAFALLGLGHRLQEPEVGGVAHGS